MNKPITIIVPMAGRGQRFVDAGWTLPKPFIDVNGRMMAEHVLEGLRIEQARFILILRKDFLPEHAEHIARLIQRFDAACVYVPRVTQGAACTVLAAREFFDDGPLVVADSDTLFCPPVFHHFIQDALQRSLNISLLTMPESNPAYSYALVDKSGRLLDVREKEIISSHALCGAYYFSDKSYFIEPLLELLIYGTTVKNEYYLSQVCREGIRQGALGGIFEVRARDVLCMGTPSQLKLTAPLLPQQVGINSFGS